jgi:hypothetical protein
MRSALKEFLNAADAPITVRDDLGCLPTGALGAGVD